MNRDVLLLFLFVSLPGLIRAGDPFNTGRLGNGALSTKELDKNTFTDSPLIEWTFFEKTNIDESGGTATPTWEPSISEAQYEYEYEHHLKTEEPVFMHSTEYVEEEATSSEYVEEEATSSAESNMPQDENYYTGFDASPTSSSELSSVPPVRFTDDCVYDISKTSGEIIFPDNDHLPRANSSEVLTCKWRIRVPLGPNIKMMFKKIALELGSEYLEIAVGMGGSTATRLITGTKLPADIVVKGTELWLTLKSRQKDGFTQLSLRFQEVYENSTFPVPDNGTCGALLVDMEGNVSSPGYPDRNYSTNEECTWYIAGPAHSVIQINIQDFKTEVYDQVRIGVGLLSKSPASRLLTLFGDLTHERETIVPANSLWINFYSDDTITDEGFYIRYKIIPRDICNTSNVFESGTGNITSVGYPSSYPINSECTWTILGHPGAHINITFHDLTIQDGRDFILVGQGKEVFDGPFTTYTGNISKVFTLTVKASNAWLHFTSDHLQGGEGYKGFNLSFLVFDVGRHGGVSIKKELEEEQSPSKDILVFRLSGVKKEEFENRLPQFRTELAKLVNDRCLKHSECTKNNGKVRKEDVEVTSVITDGAQLVVEVVVKTVFSGDYAMDSLDYDELEKLFHSDLQTLDLQHGPGGEGAVDESDLPEWLVGVIVVVILLIVVFFGMVIYSLVKERKKQRAGSYGSNAASASMCDEIEVGKEDGNIRITSFIVDNEKANGNGWVDTEASTLQRRPQSGIHGCMNPAFVDDDDQGKPKSSEHKKEEATKDAGKESSHSESCEKAVDVEHHNETGNASKNESGAKETKTEKELVTNPTSSQEETKTSDTRQVEVTDKDESSGETSDTRMDNSSECSPLDKSDQPDLSTNL